MNINGMKRRNKNVKKRVEGDITIIYVYDLTIVAGVNP